MSLQILGDYGAEILHSLIVGMLPEGACLSCTGNGLPLFVVPEVMPNQLHTFIQGTIGKQLLARLKQLSEIWFPVRHKTGSGARCLEETQIVCVRRHVSVMIQHDLGRSKHLKHVAPPN